jgi:3-hydroxy-9,10-secoandrosta-1,3,5(10)-triene-9,17-dione monooxygenase
MDSVAQTTSDAPTRAQLIERGRRLFPLLREHARRADEERHLPPELVAAFTEAGFIRTVIPRRFGGWERGLNEVVDVTIEVARACGSMGWVGSFWIDHPHWVGFFPEAAQRDVWATGPDVRVASSFVPAGRVEVAPAGWRLSGEWAWASGVGHSEWILLGGLVPGALDGPPEARLFLVPVSEVTVVDTWYSAGLRGTGSDNVIADGVFVPDHRTLVLASVREGTSPGVAVNPGPIFSAPLMAHAGYAMLAPAIGIARGMLDDWGLAAIGKAHSYTGEQVAAALPMQLRLAASAARVDAAELVLRRCLDRVESGQPITLEDRVRHRRDISFAMTLVVGAVDDLMQMAGASALRDESPLQRAWRDVRAISTHVMLNFTAASENFGRLAMGLPLNPRDPFY